MRTPQQQYYDPIDDALNLNPEGVRLVTPEEILRQPQYVFNPSNDINTSDKYVEYPLLVRGRWSYISQNVSRRCVVGSLTDIGEPREVQKPIFCQYIAEEFEDAYAYLGMRRIGAFANVHQVVAKAVQLAILPVVPPNNYELLEALNLKDVNKRVLDSAYKLEELAEPYGVTDIIKKTMQAAEQMHASTKVNLKYLDSYVQLSLHGLNEGRAGRPGKTVLDDCDIMYMQLLGQTIPDDFLNFAAKPKEDIAGIVTQVMAQGAVNQQQFAEALIDALAKRGVFNSAAPANPEIKTPEIIKTK